LQGRVFSYYAKQLAQHAVMQVLDVPIQANQIEVCKDLTMPDDAPDQACRLASD
jgi:hypothetical protein